MDRVAFEIFGFKIYWYAVLIVCGLLIAMFIASVLLKKRGYKSDLVLDYALGVLPLAIIGARIYYVLFSLERYNTFWDVINIREGGLAIYGGVIGGALGVLLVSAIKKFKFNNILDVADSIVPGLILAQAIGRWGNFFNQEAYGNPVTDPNWQFFPYAVEIGGQHYQATFFYESFFNFLGFVFLLLIALRLSGKYKGLTACLYFVWYGIVRTFVEGLRSDSLYWGSIRVSQLLSIILVVLASAAAAIVILKEKNIIFNKGSGKKNG